MNWAEKRSAMVWTFALRCVASSTMWTMRATAVWSPTFTARITSRPLLTTVPANTWSPVGLAQGHVFAGDRRLIDRRLARLDHPVHADLLAGVDHDPIVGVELIEVHALFRPSSRNRQTVSSPTESMLRIARRVRPIV